jgi:hypothetical protein
MSNSLLRDTLRSNGRPALLLWTFAFLMLALYTWHAPTRLALDGLAATKMRMGLLFSMPAQAIAAVLLPFTLQGLQRGSHRRIQATHLPFLMVFFALLGALNDGFYTLQSLVWGQGTEIWRVLIKALVDQGIYAPVMLFPITWAFAMKDSDFSWQRARQLLGPNWLQTRYLPTYVAGVMVWAPALCVLYALPLGLQFPFSALVQCLWSLMLVVLTAGSTFSPDTISRLSNKPPQTS